MLTHAMSTRGQPSLPFSDDRRRQPHRTQPRATLTIPETAKLLGIGRNLAYELAARDGELAGVPVIRVGRRLVVPQARLLSVLGLDKGLPMEGTEG